MRSCFTAARTLAAMSGDEGSSWTMLAANAAERADTVALGDSKPLSPEGDDDDLPEDDEDALFGEGTDEGFDVVEVEPDRDDEEGIAERASG
mmetsp:Transcript_7502/g.14846  ORF Transcript_7502/g.14846 Transcript_7502/m.14846 type:complete len:92 (-) Transcript_7502:2533-2808(-)